MANATRKERHSYRISYAQEVGSSIDPDLEDVATWEQELAGVCVLCIVSVTSLQVDTFLSCSFGFGHLP